MNPNHAAVGTHNNSLPLGRELVAQFEMSRYCHRLMNSEMGHQVVLLHDVAQQSAVWAQRLAVNSVQCYWAWLSSSPAKVGQSNVHILYIRVGQIVWKRKPMFFLSCSLGWNCVSLSVLMLLSVRWNKIMQLNENVSMLDKPYDLNEIKITYKKILSIFKILYSSVW